MNLPNKLTLMRIALTPVFVACFYIPTVYYKEIAALVFFVAYCTDFIDGRLARAQGIVTNFGKLMDPIADKLLTLSAFIMLSHTGEISVIVTIIVMSRELLISGFRMLAIEGGTIISASILGKLKTVSHCAAVIGILIWHRITFVRFPLDQIVLWISVCITIWSGADYIIKYAKLVKLDS